MLGCEKSNPVKNDDNNDPALEAIEPELSDVYEFEIFFPTNFDNYEAEEIDYKENKVTAYKLGQFITVDDLRAEIDERNIYAYEIVAYDDYTPRVSMPVDLSWSQFQTGYYMPSEKNRTYFGEEADERPYNVKGANRVRAYRKIDVIVPDEEVLMYEVSAMVTVENDFTDYPGKIIPLKHFVTSYVTKTPASFEYRLTGVNGVAQTYTWSEIKEGYWYIDGEKTFFPKHNSMPTNKQHIEKLVSIELYAK
jgi:hypothetical protein